MFLSLRGRVFISLSRFDLCTGGSLRQGWWSDLLPCIPDRGQQKEGTGHRQSDLQWHLPPRPGLGRQSSRVRKAPTRTECRALIFFVLKVKSSTLTLKDYSIQKGLNEFPVLGPATGYSSMWRGRAGEGPLEGRPLSTLPPPHTHTPPAHLHTLKDWKIISCSLPLSPASALTQVQDLLTHTYVQKNQWNTVCHLSVKTNSPHTSLFFRSFSHINHQVPNRAPLI